MGSKAAHTFPKAGISPLCQGSLSQENQENVFGRVITRNETWVHHQRFEDKTSWENYAEGVTLPHCAATQHAVELPFMSGLRFIVNRHWGNIFVVSMNLLVSGDHNYFAYLLQVLKI